MSAIEKVFFTPLYYPHGAWAVIRWWEARRPLYNAVVGAAGVASLATVALLFPGPPLFFAGAALLYGLLANLGYCLGPVADLALRRLVGSHAAVAGPALFRYGMVFSLGLTLLPIPLAILNQLVLWLF